MTITISLETMRIKKYNEWGENFLIYYLGIPGN